MKIDHSNTGGDRRFRLRLETGPATYTLEGLASLVHLGKITRDTEIAAEDEGVYRPIHGWPFAETLFPPKKKFEFRPAAAPKGFAPQPVEMIGEEELREIMRRDPNDVRVTMLVNLIRERSTFEGRPVAELLEDFFAQKRAELAGEPIRRKTPLPPPAPVPVSAPPPIKDVTPKPPGLAERLRSLFGP
jgi:hypothetical protein